MSDTTINQRINQLIEDFCGGNNSKFAAIVNTSEANIRNYRKDTSPKVEVVVAICEKFNISYEWLLTGNGPMTKTGLLSIPESEALKYQNELLTNRDKQLASLHQLVGALRERVATLEGKNNELSAPKQGKMYFFSALGRDTDESADAADQDTIPYRKKKK